MLPQIADLMERQPLVLLRSAEIQQAGHRRVARDERAKRRRAIFFNDQIGGLIEFFRRRGHLRIVVMHGAEHAVIRLIPAPDIFNVAAVRLRPLVKLRPGGSDIAPRHFDDGNESLRVQIINFAVQIFEIFRVDAVHVRENLFVTGNLAGEEKCPAAFVRHVLRVPLVARHMIGDVALIHPCRTHGDVRGFVIPDVPWRRVVRPVWKRGNDGDAVKTLALPQAHIILEPGVRTDGTLRVVIIPFEPERRRRVPGIAQQDEWCAVGVLQTMFVWCCFNHSPTRRHGLFVRFGPGRGGEIALLIVQAGVFLIRTAPPGPLARLGGQNAHTEDIVTVPESVATFVEPGALQVHPHLDVGVGIGVLVLRVKGQLHFFPDMHCGAGRVGIKQGNQQQQGRQGFHGGILRKKAENVKWEAPNRRKRLPNAQNFCMLPVI